MRQQQHRQDLSRGFLESEQRLEWRGPLPARECIEQLPELLARAHFVEVERSVAGLLRCEREGPQIVCRILGRWPGLIFAEDGTEREGYAVTVRWRILGGLLTRPERGGCGLFTLGFEATPLPAQGALLVVWARVEGYPSRFLGHGPQIGGQWLRRLVGGFYAAYHRRVTFRYLHRVARLLNPSG